MADNDIRAAVYDDETPEVTHYHPPEGGPRLICCGRPVLSVPLTEHITANSDLVTCSGPPKPQPTVPEPSTGGGNG